MDAPVGKPYDGPSGIGRDSHWLTHEDLLPGRDVSVQIAEVVLYPEVKFEGGRIRTNYLGLRFTGKDRVLGLNATNRKMLCKMFGSVTKAWRGQSIALYVTTTQMAGETKQCVRIREQKSKTVQGAEQQLGIE